MASNTPILPSPDEDKRILGINEMQKVLTDIFPTGGNLLSSIKGHPQLAQVPRPARGEQIDLEQEDYQAMIDNSNIFFNMQMLKSPIIAAAENFSVDGSTTEIEQFVDQIFRPLARDLCKRSMMALEYGHAPFEIKWRFDTVDLEASKSPLKGSFVLDRFLEIKPWLVQYLFNKKEQRVVGFKKTQESGIYGSEEAVATLVNEGFTHKAFWYTNEKEYTFGNPYGNSMLRRAYKAFLETENGSLWWDFYMNQKAQPMIVAHAPRGNIKLPDGRHITSAQYLMELIDLQLPRGIIGIPQEVAKGEGGKLLWDIKYLQDDRRGDLFKDYLEYWTGQLFFATLNPRNALEGASAISDRIKLEMQQFVLQEWLNQVNELLIRPLVVLNFGKKHRAQLVAKDLTGKREEFFKQIFQLSLQFLPRKQRERVMSLLDFAAIIDQAGLPRSSAEEIESLATTFAAGMNGEVVTPEQHAIQDRFVRSLEDMADSMMIGNKQFAPLS